VTIDVISNRHEEFFEIAKNATAQPVLVRSRKKRSTMLTHEVLVDVKRI
jgi:hypothetical protein